MMVQNYLQYQIQDPREEDLEYGQLMPLPHTHFQETLGSYALYQDSQQ